MSVAVVVPWRGGCPHRERAWAWLRTRYADRHPDWALVEAVAPPGPWVKANAVMPAVEECDAEIVVVADADVWSDGLDQAVSAAREGAPWAIPHCTVLRLTQDATAALLAGTEPGQLDLAEPHYPGIEGGGIVVTHRSVLQAIPLDPRFVGWGQEDQSFGMALHTLVGPAWRGTAPLLHLWHPPQERLTRKKGSEAGWRLYRRYCAARNDPNDMRRLLEDARGYLAAGQPALHDHPPEALEHH